MKIIKTIKEMQAWSRHQVKIGKSIGFVPTMGALHAGHKSLLERARLENDIVVSSIYINPTQFGSQEDLARYPQTFEADRQLCEAAGVDCVFAPENVYESDSQTWVVVEKLQQMLEGKSRPGHFNGVATVVTKLFNIVHPTRAYFGRKDAQQLVVIKTMVKELNMDLDIIPCDTVREADGLAMSSRNRFLSPTERQQALCIYRALTYCRQQVENGERNASKLVEGMHRILTIDIDYVVIVDAQCLVPIAILKDDVLVAIAVKVGSVRLIDNINFTGLS